MKRTFQGHVVTAGTCQAEALVSHGGFNTLASYQTPMLTGDKKVKCSDQNNPDLYQKSMLGKALCIPETIGSTTGGPPTSSAAPVSSLHPTGHIRVSVHIY